MLTVRDLQVSYGAIRAVDGVSLEVPGGRIVALIGANGAGKSSLLNAISGFVPYRGQVLLDGESLPRLPHRVVMAGVVQVPEGRRVFANLTVAENLEAGAYLERDRALVRKRLEYAYKLFPRLAERRNQYAGTLSGGEQQMLALARALMARPRVLLIDEPSLGLAPLLAEEVLNHIVALNRSEGLTVLLVEQNARKALAIAHHAYVLETGRIALAGSGRELLADPRIQEAYLGGRRPE